MDNSGYINSWTKHDTLKIIEEYKKHTVLYKHDHPDRLDTKSRRQAFLEILNVLKPFKPNITENQIKAKIKTLRHQFCSERKKIMESNAEGKKYDKPKLWCYNELSFLMDLKDEHDSDSARLRNFRIKEAAHNNEAKLFRNTITKSIDVIHKLSTNQMESKEEAFCQYLCTELRTLKLEESFDEFKMSIMALLQNIKEKEKKELAEGKFVWRELPSSAAAASSHSVNLDSAAKPKRKRSHSNDSILEDTVQSSNYDFDECDEEIDVKSEPESESEMDL